jgi:tetratricopeptide (TPR) repeat protein
MKMLKNLLFCFTVLSFVACGSTEANTETTETEKVVVLEKLNRKNLEAEIKKREQALNNDSLTVNRKHARELMEAYIVYADRFPAYENAADNLFKAGEIAMGLNLTVESIRCFDRVYNKFTDYEKRPYSLFLKAFVLENQAQNFEEARSIYEQFITEFPQHEMADDAAYSVKNMGKTPEELIREFEIQDSIKKAGEA